MSNYQENIKYLIQRPKTPVIKPPMHRSMFNNSIRREFQLNRGCHQTMGYAEVKVNEPSEFLKKKSRKVIRPFVGKILRYINHGNILILYTNLSITLWHHSIVEIHTTYCFYIFSFILISEIYSSNTLKLTHLT